MSVKRTAPCGHEGEVVIGAYVRCLQGCVLDPFTAGKPVEAKRRGEPGHVDFCGCKPCTMRRRARIVVFRTKDGKVGGEVPWDGTNTSISWTAPVNGTLRHWKILDDDGDVILDGMCDVEMTKGDPMRMDIGSVVPAKFSIRTAPKLPAWKIPAVGTWLSVEDLLAHASRIKLELVELGVVDVLRHDEHGQFEWLGERLYY